MVGGFADKTVAAGVDVVAISALVMVCAPYAFQVFVRAVAGVELGDDRRDPCLDLAERYHRGCPHVREEALLVAAGLRRRVHCRRGRQPQLVMPAGDAVSVIGRIHGPASAPRNVVSICLPRTWEEASGVLLQKHDRLPVVPSGVPGREDRRECRFDLFACVEERGSGPHCHDVAGAAALQVFLNAEAELQQRYAFRPTVGGARLYRGGNGFEPDPGDHGGGEDPLFERGGTVIGNRRRSTCSRTQRR